MRNVEETTLAETRPSKSWSFYAVTALRLVFGYLVAVAAAALVFAVLLQWLPSFHGPHTPHGGTTDMFEKIMELAIMCFVLGAMFGLPYTILGSIAFWYFLPRKAFLFFIIGAFCPTAAMLTMELILSARLWWETPLVLCSLPAGLVAAYFYGAIGFARGFGRWSFP